MKNNEQNSIIIGFILSLIIFILLVSFSLISIYPDIISIEKQKITLKEKLDNYNILLGKGFNFDAFKSLNKKYSSTTDKELKNLLDSNFYNVIYPKIDESLYNKSIYIQKDNNGNEVIVGFDAYELKNNFNDYLLNRLNFIEKKQNSEDFLIKKKKLEKVIPIYSSTKDVNSNLNDFLFINYIERLLNKFELSTDSMIGIGEPQMVYGSILSDPTDLYYIPLDLNLTGTKESILKFLDYIKTTGDIIIENNDFKFSNKRGAATQLIEVSTLDLNNYIDSSYKERTIYDTDLLDYLYKTGQNNEIIKANVKLMFYINKISKNRIIEEINRVIGNETKIVLDSSVNLDNSEKKYQLIHYNFNNLFDIAKKLKANPLVNKNNYYKDKMEKIYLYLNNNNLKKDFLLIKKELKKSKNINKTYDKVLKYKNIFLKIDYEMYKIAKDLGLTETKIDKNTKKVISKSIYPKDYIFENK